MNLRVLIVLLPVCIVLVLWRRRIRDLRDRFLLATILWGAWGFGLTEVLSRFNHISPSWIQGAWIAGGVAAAATAPFIPSLSATSVEENKSADRVAWQYGVILAVVLFIALISGIVAWIGPPNNWDSMTYHMTRVAHWIQNGNVAFYPACNISQLELPPGAEYFILNLQVLSGGDRLANLVQWFAFVGCLIGVTSIARLFGAGIRGQILALVFVATLPSACLEAVTTQGDLVGSLWLVCFIWLILRIWKQGAGTPPLALWLTFALCGLSAGLALATRAPSYIFVAPFVLALGGIALMRLRRRSAGPLLAAATLVILPSIPMFVRNYRFTHTLLGNPGGRTPYVNARIGAGPTTSNMMRNIALELVNPSSSCRALVEGIGRGIHHALGLDPDDAGSSFNRMPFRLSRQLWNDEDTAGNPLQLLLLIAALLTFLCFARKQDLPLGIYFLCIAFGFVAFSAYLRWQLFHTRLLLPLLILSAPFVGTVIERRWNRGVGGVIGLCLIPAALCCIAVNHLHPLFGHHSIFVRDRESMYFANRPALEAPSRAVVQRAAELHCRLVGLVLGAGDLEYPFHALLKGVDPSIRVEPVPQPDCFDPHTLNRGWRDDLKPSIIVKIDGNSASVIDVRPQQQAMSRVER